MELQKTRTDTNGLIPPYGGELKNLIIKDTNLKMILSLKLLMSLNVVREMHVM